MSEPKAFAHNVISRPEMEDFVKQFLMSSAVGILTLALASPSQAGPHGTPLSGGGHQVAPQSYNSKSYSTAYASKSNSPAYGIKSGSHNFKSSYSGQYGKKFSHGIYYAGRNHNHWSSSCWSSRYGCTCYYCPSACCWYYWCAPQSCYYPLSYFSYAPCAAAAPACAPATPVCAPCQPASVTSEQYVKILTTTTVVPCTPCVPGQASVVASAPTGLVPPAGAGGPMAP